MVLESSTAAPLGDRSVVSAVSGGQAHSAGRFSHHFEDERWEWSAEVSSMHGYDPVAMTLTTAQVLSHCHPADQSQSATLDHIRGGSGTFHARLRIVAVSGHIRHVIVAGDPLLDRNGDITGTSGYYVDVSSSEADIEDRVTETVAEITSRRAIIDQAKGMLSVIYDITADAAFAVLRWQSQATNTKLSALAEQLIDDFRSANRGPAFPPRSTYDRLLLTGHERVHRRH
jgi:hypothetical protein